MSKNLALFYHESLLNVFSVEYHYNDVIMSAMASQITGVSIVCPNVCSGSEKTSKLRVTGLCAGNSPVTGENKRPVTRKIFPFEDVITNKKFHGHWCIVSVGQWYQWGVVDEMTTLLLQIAGPFIKYSRTHDSIQYCIFILTFFMPYMFLFL